MSDPALGHELPPPPRASRFTGEVGRSKIEAHFSEEVEELGVLEVPEHQARLRIELKISQCIVETIAGVVGDPQEATVHDFDKPDGPTAVRGIEMAVWV